MAAEEMVRRRTQSASFSTNQHSPPLKESSGATHNTSDGWMNNNGGSNGADSHIQKSSPITIGKSFPSGTTPGSFGSAIINGVLGNSVGNGSGSNSWSEERNAHELNELRQRYRSLELNYYQVSTVLSLYTIHPKGVTNQ